MAKKTKETKFGKDTFNDGLTELNFDDIGGFDDFGGSPKAKSRKPSSAAAFGRGILTGATGTLKDPKYIISSTLGKGYRQTYDLADSTVDVTRTLWKDAKKEAEPVIKDLRSLANTTIGTTEKILPKRLHQKLKNFAEGGRSPTGESYNAEESEIAMTIGAIFSAYQERQNTQNQQQSEVEAVRGQVNQRIGQDSLRTLLGIQTSLSSIDAFNNQIAANYYKKSLELQYRSFYAQRKTVEVLQQSLEMSREAYKQIIHNTSLPDIVKVHGTEQAINMLKLKFLGKVTDSTSAWFKGIGSRVINKGRGEIKNFFSSIGSNISDLAMGAEMMKAARDEMGISGSEMAAEMAGSGLGSAAAKRLMKFLGPKIGNRLSRFNRYNAMNEALQSTHASLPWLVSQWAGSAEGNNGSMGGLVRFLKEAVGQHKVNNVIQESRSRHLDQQVMFDLQFKTTVEEIIPAYLSKIAHATSSMAGFKNSEQEIWDWSKGRLSTARSMAGEYRKKFYNEGTMSASRATLGGYIDSVDPDHLITDKATRQKFARYLDMKSRRHELIQIADFMDTEHWPRDWDSAGDDLKLTSAQKEKIAEALQNYATIDASAQRDTLNGTFTGVRGRLYGGLSENKQSQAYRRRIAEAGAKHMTTRASNFEEILEIAKRPGGMQILQSMGVALQDSGGNWLHDSTEFDRRLTEGIGSPESHWRGGWIRRARGGSVRGGGGRYSDKVKALLDNGEFVVNRDAASDPEIRRKLHEFNAFGAEHRVHRALGGKIPRRGQTSDGMAIEDAIREMKDALVAKLDQLISKPSLSIGAGEIGDWAKMKLTKAQQEMIGLKDKSGKAFNWVAQRATRLAGAGWSLGQNVFAKSRELGGKLWGLSMAMLESLRNGVKNVNTQGIIDFLSNGIGRLRNMGQAGVANARAMVTNVATQAYRFAEMPFDIYVKDANGNLETSPRLKARVFRQGGYYVMKNGQRVTVTKLADINGAVYDESGEVLGAEDSRKQFFDSTGKPILSISDRLAKGLDRARQLPGQIKQRLSEAWNRSKGFFKRLIGGAKKTFSGTSDYFNMSFGRIGSPSPAMAAAGTHVNTDQLVGYARNQVELLSDILTSVRYIAEVGIPSVGGSTDPKTRKWFGGLKLSDMLRRPNFNLKNPTTWFDNWSFLSRSKARAGNLLTAAGQKVSNTFKNIRANLPSGVWDKLSGLSGDLKDRILNALPSFNASAVRQSLSNSKQRLGTFFGNAKDTVASVLGNVKENANDIISKKKGQIGGWWSKTGSGLLSSLRNRSGTMFGKARASGSGFFKNFMSGLRGGPKGHYVMDEFGNQVFVPNPVEDYTGQQQYGSGGIGTALGGAVRGAGRLGVGIAKGGVDMLGALLSGASGLIGSGVGAIRGMFGKPSNDGRPKWTTLGDVWSKLEQIRKLMPGQHAADQDEEGFRLGSQADVDSRKKKGVLGRLSDVLGGLQNKLTSPSKTEAKGAGFSLAKVLALFPLAAEAFGGLLGKLTGSMGVLGKLVGLVGKAGFGLAKFGGKAVWGTTKLVAKAGLGIGRFALTRALPWAAGAAMDLGVGALSAVGGLLSAPVLLGAAGVAGLAYGGYKLYQYLTKQKAPIARYRLAQYGFDLDDKDRAPAIFALEGKLRKVVTCQKGGQATMTTGVTIQDLLGIFGIDSDDQEHVRDFILWFSRRFKPIYLGYQTQLFNMTGKLDLDKADQLLTTKQKLEMIDKVGVGVDAANNPYSMMASPFPHDKVVKFSTSDISDARDSARSEIRKNAKENDAALAAQAKTAKSGATKKTEKNDPNKKPSWWDSSLNSFRDYASTKLGDAADWAKKKYEQFTGTAAGRAAAKAGEYVANVAEALTPAAKKAVATFIKAGKWSKNLSTTLFTNIKAAAERYGIPEAYMRTMAMIESGGDSNAVSPTGAKGIYQFIVSTGKQYGLFPGGVDKRDDEQLNIDAGARLARDNAAFLRRILGTEPEPWMLYLAHQQGAGGVLQLLRLARENKDAPPELRRAMDQNGGQGLSPSQFVDLWRARYSKMQEAALGTTPTSATTPVPVAVKPPAANNNTTPALSAKTVPTSAAASKTATAAPTPVVTSATPKPAVVAAPMTTTSEASKQQVANTHAAKMAMSTSQMADLMEQQLKYTQKMSDDIENVRDTLLRIEKNGFGSGASNGQRPPYSVVKNGSQAPSPPISVSR